MQCDNTCPKNFQEALVMIEEYKILISQKDAFITELQTKLSRQASLGNSGVDNSQIVEIFRSYANKRNSIPQKEDWEELYDYVKSSFPNLYKLNTIIRDVEYKVLILTLINLRSGDISYILNLSNGNVSNIKRRVYEKLAHKRGNAKGLKFIIDEMTKN